MKTLTTITVAVLLCSVAFAGDFEYQPYSPGFYLQGYPAFQTASKMYDADGETVDYADSWSAFGMSLRPTYWGMAGERRWQISAEVPFVSWSVGDVSESGIGDIQASASFYVLDNHEQGQYFSVWFYTDIPVGDDAKGLGTGQLNLRPGVAFSWDQTPYMVNTSVFYNIRMENSDYNLKPGNEIWANASFGWSANEQWMPAWEIETVWGADSEVNSVTWTDSKSQWFKTGPSVSYQINPTASFKVGGFYTVMGKNTNQDIDIDARVVWGF